jgi:hypothetical protein
MNRPRLLAACTTATLLSTMLLVTAGAGIAAASGSFPWNGQNGQDALNSAACQDAAANNGTMLWIFTGKGVSNVVLNWDSTSVPMTEMSGGSWHATVTFFDPNLTANQPISVTFDGTLQGHAVLTISGCNEGEQPPETQTADISTTVHLGSTDTGAPVVVNDASPAPLGSYVHDSADLTFTGGGTLPSGSNVVFYFWKNHSCAGDPDDTSASVDVSGDSSPQSLDPYLAEGPLAASTYSYQAFFTSGNTDQIDNVAGDCEPFTVSKADVTPVTSVVREDTGAAVALGGTVPLGTSVHDTATINGQAAGLPASMTVTYHFFYSASANPNCATGEVSSLNSKTWPQDVAVNADGTVPTSQSTGSLAAGYYSFDAVYSGDNNYNGPTTSACEPFAVYRAPLTIGYWGNHLDNTLQKGKPNPNCSGLPNGTSCSTSGPYTAQYLPKSLGSYTVDTILKAAKVFAANNCSNATTSSQNAVGCLAAQLLGAKLNVANSSNPCINSTIASADAFLTSIAYIGPTGTYSLTSAQRTTALNLQAALTKYNQGGGC